MNLRTRIIKAIPSLVLVVVAAIYLIASLGYNEQTRAMPLGVAALAILLMLLEMMSRGDGKVARNLRRVLQGSGSKPPVPGLDGQAGQRHSPGKELAAFGWIFGLLAMALVAGFYVAIPIYVAGYLYFYAGKRPVAALGTAVALTGMLYGMFELLLGYGVFGGLIAGDFM